MPEPLEIRGPRPVGAMLKSAIGVVFGLASIGALADGDTTSAIVLAIVSIVVIVVGSIDARRRRRYVVADEDGLRVKDLDGTRTIPWGNIEALRVGGTSRSVAVFVILVGSGVPVALEATIKRASPEARSKLERHARELEALLLGYRPRGSGSSGRSATG